MGHVTEYKILFCFILFYFPKLAIRKVWSHLVYHFSNFFNFLTLVEKNTIWGKPGLKVAKSIRNEDVLGGAGYGPMSKQLVVQP